MIKRNFINGHSKNVGLDTYPKQDTGVLGTIVNINYRSKDIGLQQHLVTPPEEAHRPADDADNFDFTQSQEYEDRYTTNKDFLIIRKDIEEPFKMVAVSADCSDVIVATIKTAGIVDLDAIHCIVAGDATEHLGCKADLLYPTREFNLDEMMDGIPLSYLGANDNTAFVFADQSSNPEYTVFIEFIDMDKFRIILDTECIIDTIDSNDSEYKPIGKDIRQSLLLGRTPYYDEPIPQPK